MYYLNIIFIYLFIIIIKIVNLYYRFKTYNTL